MLLLSPCPRLPCTKPHAPESLAPSPLTSAPPLLPLPSAYSEPLHDREAPSSQSHFQASTSGHLLVSFMWVKPHWPTGAFPHHLCHCSLQRHPCPTWILCKAFVLLSSSILFVRHSAQPQGNPPLLHMCPCSQRHPHDQACHIL